MIVEDTNNDQSMKFNHKPYILGKEKEEQPELNQYQNQSQLAFHNQLKVETTDYNNKESASGYNKKFINRPKEYFLVYGYTLEVVASLSCLLVLFTNLSSSLPNTNGYHSNSHSTQLGHFKLSTISHGLAGLAGVLGVLFPCWFLRSLIQSQSKLIQPHPRLTSLFLLVHLLFTFSWTMISLSLASDTYYHHCSFSRDPPSTVQAAAFAMKFHQSCDLMWLLKFITFLNLLVWSVMTSFLTLTLFPFATPPFLARRLSLSPRIA